MKRQARAVLLGFLALVAIALWSTLTIRPAASGMLTLRVLDVGQGDAILVTTPLGHSVLVDAGPDRDVVTALDRSLPLTRRVIDLAIVSHNHSDHIGGFDAVFERYPARKVWLSGAVHTSQTYLTMLGTIRTQSIPAETVSASHSVTLDGVRLTALYPLTTKRDERPENQHDASVVVLVEYGERSMVLTGDAEAEHEADMLASGQIPRPVDVLKVGHHGSDTSTSEAWLDALKPSIAIISVGRDNSYGHPHQVVLDRLSTRGIQVLRTDQRGSVTITTDGHTLWTDTER